jgi:hypothetical protein
VTWSYYRESDDDEDSEDSDSRVDILLPALLIWSSASHTWIWLMLDEREGKRDKVYELSYTPQRVLGEDGDDELDGVYSGWIEWQRHRWEEIEEAAKMPQKKEVWPRLYAHIGRKKKRGPIPAQAWIRRDEPGYVRVYPQY